MLKILSDSAREGPRLQLERDGRARRAVLLADVTLICLSGIAKLLSN